jgi:hypothetical protein
MTSRKKNIKARKQQNRTKTVLGTGNGDYMSNLKNFINNTNGVVQKLDKKINQLKSNPVARQLGRTAMKWAGGGDYEVTSTEVVVNSLINPLPSSLSVPMMSNRGRHAVRVVDSEFVGTIRSGALSGGSTVFTNQSFVLNPTNPALFPWLSRMAPLFDQWVPLGIVVRFKSTSSEFNGASQALGTVVIAADYDANDPIYSTRVEMENSDHAVSCKASEKMLFGVECDPDERPTKVLFTGTPSNGSGLSLNLYQLCNLQVATQGMSVADVELGELWIDYDFCFYKKQLVTDADLAFFRAETSELLDIADPLSFGEFIVQGSAPITIDGGIISTTAVGRQFLLIFRYNSPSAFDHTFAAISSSIGIDFEDDGFNEATFAKGDGTHVVTWMCSFKATSYTNGFTLGPAPVEMTGVRTIFIVPISDSLDMSI